MRTLSLMIFTLLIPSILMAESMISPELYEGTMTTPTCETYVEWTGKNIQDIDLSIIETRNHRIIKPDSMVTMDYMPDRLNIETTDDGIILTQTCG